jgi:hypothetical protein
MHYSTVLQSIVQTHSHASDYSTGKVLDHEQTAPSVRRSITHSLRRAVGLVDVGESAGLVDSSESRSDALC